MTTWQRLPAADAELEWLRQPDVDSTGIGYNPGEWGASTWVLHAMYEHSTLVTSMSHDAVYRARLARGLEQPDMLGEVDLSAQLTVSGVPLGYEEKPGPEWTRLRWGTLAGRCGGRLDEEDPDWPSELWLDQDWPATTIPPPAGSLDQVSWTSLVQVLVEASGPGAATPVVAYYDFLTAGDWDGDSSHVLSGPLGDITSLVTELGYEFSPSNWWAEDRSWFVYTDYDVNTTKVSGSAGLIDTVDSAPELETVRWRGPGGRGARSYAERMRDGRQQWQRD